MLRFTLAVCLASLAGCKAAYPTPKVPMEALRQQELGPDQATGLLVLLPGRADRAECFETRGILEMVRELAPTFDAIAADAHFGYYEERSLLPRLEVDLIRPAVEAGYKQIWLLGISVGSLGSVYYASEHPGQIDGVLLLGPFLGHDAVAREVLAAPNLASWDSRNPVPEGSRATISHNAWRWLQSQTGPNADAVILMGYGSMDGPGTAVERLQEALPPEHFATVNGGHNWNAWRPLIRELLPTMVKNAQQRQALSQGE
jgi:pimeloyl-ACP methyl ester carboxylesterase